MKTATEMLQTGASRRQIHYWTERGLLKAHKDSVGSGHAYTYDDSEWHVCERMARLIAGGVAVGVAADVARQMGRLVEVAPKVWVLVLDPGYAFPEGVSWINGEG
jgi:hypothetical protein